MSKNNDKSKPLRSSSNTLKDLYNTYIKNSEKTEKNTMKESKETIIDIQEETSEDSVKEQAAEEVSELETESSVEEQTEEIDEVKVLEAERDELKNQVMRMVAEMDNMRKRAQREKNEMIDYANERLLFQMLPVLDDLSNAIQTVTEKTDMDTFVSGIQMIYNKTMKTFENAGVKQMDDPTGKPFDVNAHDAVLAMPSDFPEGDVCQLAQPGFMLKDKVLRHAKVVTSQGKPE